MREIKIPIDQQDEGQDEKNDTGNRRKQGDQRFEIEILGKEAVCQDTDVLIGFCQSSCTIRIQFRISLFHRIKARITDDSPIAEGDV